MAHIWNTIQAAVSSLAHWLATLAASVAWQLWHGTGLDHLCQIILHILKITAISVGIVLLAPWAFLIAYKILVFVWIRLLPIIVKGVKAFRDCLQRREKPARSTHQQQVYISRSSHRSNGLPRSQEVDRVTTWLLATSDPDFPVHSAPPGYGTCPFMDGDDRPPPYESGGAATPVTYMDELARGSVAGYHVIPPGAMAEGARDDMAALSPTSITSTLPPYSS